MEFIEEKCKAVDKFFSSFISVFPGQNGKYSKCPRCKGSGLMVTTGGHASNMPCWFCEGVGIMPIIGLEGFLLARAPAQVKTCALMADSLSLVSLEPSIVNHRGTRCKIMRYKPAIQICKFLSNVHETPLLADLESKAHLNFLSNHALCGTNEGLSDQSQVKNEIGSFTADRTPLFDTSWGFKTHNNILKFIKPESLDISKSFIDVQPKEQPADTVVTHKHSLDISKSFIKVQPKEHLADTVVNRKQYNESTKVGQTNGFNGSNYPYSPHSFGGILSLNFISVLKLPAQKKGFFLWTGPLNDSILTGSGTRAHLHFGLVLPTVRHTKVHKRPRRVKNRIREKEQKKANENARRILQSLTPRTSDMLTAPADELLPPNVMPEDVLPVMSIKLDGKTDIHVRRETSKRLFFNFQRDQSIMDGRDSKNLWINFFSFEFLREKGLSLKYPARALKV